MNLKCTSNKCSKHPYLRQTGYHPPHPLYFCPVCKRGYWEYEKIIKDDSGKVIRKEYLLRDYPDNPEKWGAKSVSYYFNKFDYWWRPAENKLKHEAEERAKRKEEAENEETDTYW